MGRQLALVAGGRKKQVKNKMMNLKNTIGALCVGGLVFASCASNKNKNTEPIVQKVEVQFNADSAYNFCKAQCDFGPRVMNTEAHDLCGQWIESKFREYGCSVQLQEATLDAFDGTKLKSKNIVASLNPDAQARILLCAHWDARPWADNDPDEANHKEPVMAANDGASGVAVMLEVARVLAKDSTLQIGVDFVCFDAEDYGEESNEDSWALGAQHWANNAEDTQRYIFGILLDMVGGENARFYQEQFSLQAAQSFVDKVWTAAQTAGYGSFFPRETGGAITDDHVPVNRVAHIPCIDIIPYYPECEQSSFGPTWHTINDTMEHIDSATLKAVGQTLLQVILE